MIQPAAALEINREGWNRVAPLFHGRESLPVYGPLVPTEDELGLLTGMSISRVVELGCGNGRSLAWLGQRGADELWGVDLSPVQITFAEETLRPIAQRVRLIESPMESNPGVPQNYFDLVFSIYGIRWTTDLPATLNLVSRSLRPGGHFIVSGEHPVYGCLEWNGTHYVVETPYFTEGPQEHPSWNGVPIVIHRRTLGTFVTSVLRAGLQIETLVEPIVSADLATPEQTDPSRWYSVPRATSCQRHLFLRQRSRQNVRQGTASVTLHFVSITRTLG